MIAIALDVGTTKICALAVERDSGEVLAWDSADNSFSVGTSDPGAQAQDPEAIFQACQALCDSLARRCGPVCGIGVSGQMHGILYTNRRGMAVSPLYTWQNGWGDMPYRGGRSFAQYLAGFSPGPVASGYGFVTHFCLQSRDALPANGVRLCTIGDYVVMRLTGGTEPLLHATNAASLGFFDLCAGFDRAALARAGVCDDMLPECTSQTAVAGETAQGVPVCAAIGDNQASFLGAVADADRAMLANIGTGSQLSFVGGPRDGGGLEARPFFDGAYLHVGAGLCGGKAYAVLKDFFQQVLAMADCKPAKPLYAYMDEYLAGSRPSSDVLRVSTKFNGTRSDPRERGKIENISLANFTPDNLMTGFLAGIVEELRELMPCGLVEKTYLVAAGNGVRKNPTLVHMLSEAFDRPVRIPLYPEEAAYGAALFALTAAGRFPSLGEARKIIRYQAATEGNLP